MTERILTIGMAAHQNFGDVWFTLQSIRTYFSHLGSDIELLVVDNSPYHEHGDAMREYIKTHFVRKGDGWRGHYVSAAPRETTSIRNLVFHCSETPYVLCIDSHVQMTPGSLDKLVGFLKTGDAGDDLYHGPAYTESGSVYATHMNPAFRGENFGTWAVMQPKDPKMPGFHEKRPPFEIPMHGMGLFCCRRDSWLGFPVAFQHFSGEEGYIHEKYRLAGRRCWCLPFLGWYHKYSNLGNRTTYKNTREAKLWNHMLGFADLGLDVNLPARYFGHALKVNGVQPERLIASYNQRLSELNLPRQIKRASPPFMGFPIRMNDGPGNDSEDYSEFEKRLV